MNQHRPLMQGVQSARLPERFEVISVLGIGGVGTVLHVLDRSLNHQSLALKLPHAHLQFDEDAVQRVRREIVVGRQLAHPGIVRILQSAELSDGTPYFTMEYIEGCDLDSYRQQHAHRRVPQEEVKYLVEHILTALAFAHSKGVCHRDLKPKNILLGANGAVKIADFGIAHALSDGLEFTRTGEAVGSPAYMAPEQFSSRQSAKTADLYAMGIMTFELLGGRLPFEQNSYVALARAHRESPVPLEVLRSLSVAGELVEFVEKCTNKSVEQRFSSAQEAIEFLRSRGSLPSPEVRGRVCSLVRAQTVEFKNSFFNRNSFFLGLAALVLAVWWGLHDENNLITRIRADATQVRTQLGMDLYWIERFLGFPTRATVDEAGLIAALRAGDLRTFRALLQLGADPSRPIPGDREGNSVLHLAAESSIDAILSSVNLGYPPRTGVSHPKLLSVKNRQGESVLLRTVKLRQIGTVSTMISIADAEAFQPDHEGYTPLLFALTRGDSTLVSMLLAERALHYLEAQGPDGRTVTHVAAVNRDSTTLARLLKRRSLALVRDRAGRTPLMLLLEQPPSASIAEAEQLETLRLLLADPAPQLEARDNAGQNLQSYLRRAAPELRAFVESLAPLAMSAETASS